MRNLALAAAVALTAAAVGGALAWGLSRPDVDEIAIEVTATAPPPMPITQDASVVWAGNEVLVWGGGTGDKVNSGVHDQGLAYDPEADAWRTLAPAPLEARERHAAVWTGEEMVVWGGTRRHHGVGDLLDGARYDPATDSWAPMAPAPPGTDRSGSQAVVVDGRVVIGAGYGPTDEDTVVLVYDLEEDRWERAPASGPVRQLLPVSDRVALVTTTPPSGEGAATTLRVELLNPSTGERHIAGRVDVERYPAGAGLLEHDGRLTLLVEPNNGETQVFRVEDRGYPQALEPDGSVEVPAPARMEAMLEPPPLLRDGSRRVVIDGWFGGAAGIDLATGDSARGDSLSACLANATHAVGGAHVLVWGRNDCEGSGTGGPALITATWEERGD